MLLSSYILINVNDVVNNLNLKVKPLLAATDFSDNITFGKEKKRKTMMAELRETGMAPGGGGG